MGASRFNPVARFAQGGWRFRTISIAGILVVLGLSRWIGAHLWANSQFRAAREASEKRLFVDARDHIRQCLKIRPTDPDVHFLAAQIERRMSEFKAAEEHLNAYKRVRGITDEFQTEWILLRAQAGELPQHEQALLNCVKNNHPQSLEILETLAAGFMREARFSAAGYCLHEWLRRDPKNLAALEWRAMTREHLQRRDEAAEDYRQVLSLAADRWQARLRLARLLMEMTYFAEASRELEILNTTHGEEEQVRVAWGQCLFSQGKTDEARKVFVKLLTERERHPLVFLYLGRLEADPVAAAKWFRKALGIHPANLEARFALYTSLRQVGLDKEAAAELRIYNQERTDQSQTRKLYELMEKNPTNPEHLSKLGGHLLEKFDNPQGFYLLQRALAFDPNHRPAHEALVRYYEKSNQPNLAAKHREFTPAAKK